jgi:hypothetical protein
MATAIADLGRHTATWTTVVRVFEHGPGGDKVPDVYNLGDLVVNRSMREA